MKESVIGIVLVNYNGEKDTIDCINSIHNSKNVKYEIVVVDNNSSDKSYNELLKQESKRKFKLLRADVNNGFSAGNNIGIRYFLEKKEISHILLLNNDTEITESTLIELLKPLSDKKNFVSTGKIKYYSNKDIIWYAGGEFNYTVFKSIHYEYKERDRFTSNIYQNVNFASGCCLCLKREVLENVGLLDESFFLYEEDTEYCLRLSKNNYKIVYNPNAIIYHKVNSTTSKVPDLASYYIVRNKFKLIKEYSKGVNKIICYFYNIIRFIYLIIKKELSIKVFFTACIAFMNGEEGKKMSK